jgi:hypothetical protein
MKVWFDDQLLLEAAYKSFGKGRRGLVSFDDLGAFRNIVATPAIGTVVSLQSMKTSRSAH